MTPEDMAFFHEGTRRICGSLDIDEVLHDCLAFLRKYMPADIIQLTIYDEDSRIIHIIGTASKVPLKDFGVLIPLSEAAIENAEDSEDRAIKVDNSHNHQVAKEINTAMGLKNTSIIGLRLMVKDAGIGAIVLISDHPNQFTDEHIRLISLLHDPFAIAMSNTLRFQEVVRLQQLLKDDNQYLNRELHHLSGDKIIGEKFGLKYVMEQVHQVTPLNSQVLLLGETGVGKEVIANAIHYASPRRNNPFIRVNCGAIPDNLLDSELFGHEKGAFTGAISRKRGRFERAHTGTIFLDEVGELPQAAQVRLLRVLENKEIERVGGSDVIPVDVRIIAATHRNLQEMVENKAFREDLYFRLNVFPITIPPLRHRKVDIPALVHHFIERKASEMKLRYWPVLAPGEMERLRNYDWPGNIRELGNMVERGLIRHQTRNPDKPLRLHRFHQNGSFPEFYENGDRSGDTPLTLDEVNRRHILHTMEKTRGKIQGKDGAAAILGLHPSTLRHRMRKLDIPFGKQ